MALYSCFVNAGATGTNNVFDTLNGVIQNNNASLIICKKFKPSGSYVVATGETAISSIAISSTSTLFLNNSVKYNYKKQHLEYFSGQYNNYHFLFWPCYQKYKKRHSPFILYIIY